MNKLLNNLFGFKTADQQVAEIVERLLLNNQITAKEATVLLRKNLVVNVDRIEVSSGARVVGGDDNTTEYYNDTIE